MDDEVKRRVVVGVDGSPPASEALRWAAKEAEIRKAELHVVGVWSFPAYLDPMGGVHPLPSLIEATEARERQLLDEVIVSVLGESPSVPIVKVLRCGSTAPELLAESEGADLLVVGSRGRGGFLSVLLGSTAMHCVQHAKVPVAVVRAAAN